MIAMTLALSGRHEALCDHLYEYLTFRGKDEFMLSHTQLTKGFVELSIGFIRAHSSNLIISENETVDLLTAR